MTTDLLPLLLKEFSAYTFVYIDTTLSLEYGHCRRRVEKVMTAPDYLALRRAINYLIEVPCFCRKTIRKSDVDNYFVY